ncbi:hypothetical protein [Virgibacillus phage Mimir87]|nr:hypothetical protein [Virgibacillus phage Mimir87]
MSMPYHIKERILMFFMKTSVPRILEEKRKEEHSNDNRANAQMDAKV